MCPPLAEVEPLKAALVASVLNRKAVAFPTPWPAAHACAMACAAAAVDADGIDGVDGADDDDAGAPGLCSARQRRPLGVDHSWSQALFSWAARKPISAATSAMSAPNMEERGGKRERGKEGKRKGGYFHKGLIVKMR
jgi:hypothetical protein